MQAKIAVIGGGIGGLTAALSLLQAGFDVHVYEQTRALREVGAGIQISPNAARIVHGLGLADELANLGVRPLAFHQRRWQDGRTLLNAPLGDTVVQTFGFPYYQSHRADVLTMLMQAFPSERLHVGHRLTDLSQRSDGVTAEFENNARVDADILIGADGIHSRVRHLLFGAENPRFTGCVAYRGLIPIERIKRLDLEIAAQMWIGPGKHIIVYYVASQRLLNFVGVIDQDAWTTESWTEPGDIAQLRAAFADWDPGLRVIIDAISETFVWGLFDRPSLSRWSAGRVTLLGDACHPMLPFMAQGAAQAMEDGASLATCLSRGDDVVDALRRYESLRLPRASRIQGMAGTNKTRFHLSDGPAQQERDAKMAAGGTDWSIDAVRWIYQYDAWEAAKTGDLGLPSADLFN